MGFVVTGVDDFLAFLQIISGGTFLDSFRVTITFLFTVVFVPWSWWVFLAHTRVVSIFTHAHLAFINLLVSRFINFAHMHALTFSNFTVLAFVFRFITTSITLDSSLSSPC